MEGSGVSGTAAGSLSSGSNSGLQQDPLTDGHSCRNWTRGHPHLHLKSLSEQETSALTHLPFPVELGAYFKYAPSSTGKVE